jgi:hypothetical protein
MQYGFALRYIAEVMKWSEPAERIETKWLQLMSDFKYDSYQGFLSGSRFSEALLDWLQQFEEKDRPQAYKLLSEKLIFINSREIQHLVQRAYPAQILPQIRARAARQLNTKTYMLASTPETRSAVTKMARRTLFVGLSDGARLDLFRRANIGVISNEQVVTTYEVADNKWEDMMKELWESTGDKQARFEIIVLMDDFTASGTSLLRWEENKWKGKLKKTCDQLQDHADSLAHDYDVIIHHYIGTSQAQTALTDTLNKAKVAKELSQLFVGHGGFPNITFSMDIPENCLIRPDVSFEWSAFLKKYYDPKIMTASLRRGGEDAIHGFAQCGLPLVIEHNTPNNSLAILWAESPSESSSAHTMRPLFRRRQRHS